MGTLRFETLDNNRLPVENSVQYTRGERERERERKRKKERKEGRKKERKKERRKEGKKERKKEIEEVCVRLYENSNSPFQQIHSPITNLFSFQPFQEFTESAERLKHNGRRVDDEPWERLTFRHVKGESFYQSCCSF